MTVKTHFQNTSFDIAIGQQMAAHTAMGQPLLHYFLLNWENTGNV
jgi:hypothetical protein